jgi:hypothetical protein
MDAFMPKVSDLIAALRYCDQDAEIEFASHDDHEHVFVESLDYMNRVRITVPLTWVPWVGDVPR